MTEPLHVYSEIGRLKKVLLHRPGKEIENLTPDLMERLLFDDIPYLKVAQEEHDAFAQTLRDAGVEVVYLLDLMAETLKANPNMREDFIDLFVEEAAIRSTRLKTKTKDLFMSYKDDREMLDKMVAGVRTTEVKFDDESDMYKALDTYPFVTDPMPNLYFTRDPFATIGRGISLNHMYSVTRNRETIFAKHIFRHHPDYKDANIPFYYDRDEKTAIEGGDELILSKKTIAIGVSQRTEAYSIEKMAKKIFADCEVFDTIMALKIPNKRAFMHLDTVFTQIDHDKFTVHSEIEEELQVFKITRGGGDKLNIAEEKKTLQKALEDALGRKVTLFKCGNGDLVDAAREQWNDGSNTLAIAPNEVVVYSRNHVTNKLLEENGVKLHIIPSSELSRGRGGPRCMSMPLVREDI